MEDSTAAIIKIAVEVLLGIGGLSGLATVLLSRKKVHAETKNLEKKTSTEIPVKAAGDLVNSSSEVIDQYKELLDEYKRDTDRKLCELKNEIIILQGSLRQYAKRIAYLMNGIHELIEQVMHLGEKPCFTPDDWQPVTDQRAETAKSTASKG